MKKEELTAAQRAMNIYNWRCQRCEEHLPFDIYGDGLCRNCYKDRLKMEYDEKHNSKWTELKEITPDELTIEDSKVEDEKCGVFNPDFVFEGTSCQNPKGNCPVHDMSNRKKMQETAEKIDKHLREMWLPQPVNTGQPYNMSTPGKFEPVSTVEDWEEEFDDKFGPDLFDPAEQKKATESFVIADKPIKDFIRNLLAQAREEERERVKKIVDELSHSGRITIIAETLLQELK